jgi:hypothetical protein
VAGCTVYERTRLEVRGVEVSKATRSEMVEEGRCELQYAALVP